MSLHFYVYSAYISVYILSFYFYCVCVSLCNCVCVCFSVFVHPCLSLSVSLYNENPHVSVPLCLYAPLPPPPSLSHSLSLSVSLSPLFVCCCVDGYLVVCLLECFCLLVQYLKTLWDNIIGFKQESTKNEINNNSSQSHSWRLLNISTEYSDDCFKWIHNTVCSNYVLELLFSIQPIFQDRHMSFISTDWTSLNESQSLFSLLGTLKDSLFLTLVFTVVEVIISFEC